jgi:hypothetical protein
MLSLALGLFVGWVPIDPPPPPTLPTPEQARAGLDRAIAFLIKDQHPNGC